MIEEAAGTMMYESKKQQAQKTIEKKDSKLREINDVSRKSIDLIKLIMLLMVLCSDFKRGNHSNFDQVERRKEHLFGISEGSTRIGAFNQIVYCI